MFSNVQNKQYENQINQSCLDTSHFHLLPDELYVQIFSLLSAKQLASLRIVCTKWNQIGSTEQLWKRLFQNDFQSNQLPAKCKNWFLAYKHFYTIEQTISNGISKFEPFKKAHREEVTSLIIHGDYLVSGSKDCKIKIWDTRTHICVRTLHEHTAEVTSLEIHSNSLVSGSKDGIIKMWDITKNISEKTFVGHSDDIIFLGNKDHYLVSASKDKTIKIWDTKTGQCLKTLDDQVIYKDSVQIQGNQLYTVSSDTSIPSIKNIKIWDIASGKCLRTIEDICHDGMVPNMQVADGLLLLSFLDATVKIWDLKKDRYVHSIEAKVIPNDLICFKKVQDGRFYISFFNGTIKIWDTATRELLQILENSDPWITSLKVFGNLLITISLDLTLKIWNTNNGKLLHTLKGTDFYPPLDHLQIHGNKIFCTSFNQILSWTFNHSKKA